MRLLVPASGPVDLSGVAAQLEDFLEAAEDFLDSEQQAGQLTRILDGCPVAAQIGQLQPYLSDLAAVTDAARIRWQDTLRGVLAPSRLCSGRAVEIKCPTDPQETRLHFDKRIRWLESTVVRAEQVRRIMQPLSSEHTIAQLCDSVFCIARYVELDEVGSAHCILEKTAATRALSRELAAPFLRVDDAGSDSLLAPALWKVSVASALDTDRHGEQYLRTEFKIFNLSRTLGMRLEQLQIRNNGAECSEGTHTVDLGDTALLLPHTKAEPSYSIYVLLVPLSQLRPVRAHVCEDATARSDLVALDACARFAERGMGRRFQARWPRYEFTWRFREQQVPEPAVANFTTVPCRGLWKRLGF